MNIRELFDWLRKKDIEAALEHPPIVCERSDPDECVILRPNFDMREQMMSDYDHPYDEQTKHYEEKLCEKQDEIERLHALHLDRTKLTDRMIKERDHYRDKYRDLQTDNERLRAALVKIAWDGDGLSKRVAGAALKGG